MNELLQLAQDFSPDAKELLVKLAAIDTGTGQEEGILAGGELLGEALTPLGFSLAFVPAAGYGRHLLARRPGRGRRILILGHLDTVYPPGTARPPASEGDRLAGPGVLDCKGGLVLAVTACRIMERIGRPAPSISILINADEEVGSLSSRASIEAEAASSMAALIVEPSSSHERLITSRRGIGRYVLRVFGRAAHAGADRGAGINAVVELAAKILALERLNDEDAFSVTVGTIAGGVRPNVVPDYAQAEIDLRVSTPEQVIRAEPAIKRAAAFSTVSGANYRLEGGITRPPMPATPAGGVLFDLAKLVGADLGLDLTAAASGGGSDGNFCAAMGVPTLDGLGPAGSGAHSGEEHILWSSMAPRAALLAAICLRLGEMPCSNK